MSIEFEALKTSTMRGASTFMRPTQSFQEQVSINDPAVLVMTDLSKVSLIVARPFASMETANAKMIRYGVRTLLVLDTNDHVAGILTANDILGEKPTRFIQNMGGTHADIMVRDLMTPQRELQVMRIQDVRTATVGHIVATLKKSGKQHGVVVDENADGTQAVCGIFSTTQIARQLGTKVSQLLENITVID